jgi:transposase
VIKLTPGQAGDAPHAADRLAGATRGRVRAVVADTASGPDAIVARVRRRRARVVVPSLGCRTKPRRYGRALDRGPNVVERFGNKVKRGRRVATGCDKLDVCYLAFAHLAAVLVGLRHPETAHTT